MYLVCVECGFVGEIGDEYDVGGCIEVGCCYVDVDL